MPPCTLHARIAKDENLTAAQVAQVILSLNNIIVSDLKATGSARIPMLVTFKSRVLPARPATTKKMFGKEVAVRAKEASKIVTAYPTRALRTAVRGHY